MKVELGEEEEDEYEYINLMMNEMEEKECMMSMNEREKEEEHMILMNEEEDEHRYERMIVTRNDEEEDEDDVDHRGKHRPIHPSSFSSLQPPPPIYSSSSAFPPLPPSSSSSSSFPPPPPSSSSNPKSKDRNVPDFRLRDFEISLPYSEIELALKTAREKKMKIGYGDPGLTKVLQMHMDSGEQYEWGGGNVIHEQSPLNDFYKVRE